ncbi:kinase-like domain-containing protein [Sparassis latifolia]
MVTDGEDESQATEQPTQSTQQVDPSQHDDDAMDAHLWGYLLPCNPNLYRVDFHKMKLTYTIGRNREAHLNDVVLPGMKISNYHCKISWDGKDSRDAAVTVHDLSSNGTFINGERIGKGKHWILKEGNEVAFGTSSPQPANGGLEDYRFVYRHLAGGPPLEGLYAHYQLHAELGKGSFATVMKAMNRDNGKWYAVKIIQSNKLLSKDQADPHNSEHAKLVREISILESLSHENICQLKEVFFEESNINIVLEFVSGGDLLDYILARDGLSEPEAQHITYQICDALAYIHNRGIAHRDLKPENVLLTSDTPPVVKVADFGLAKAIDSCTMLRTMCGTPCYLAPEVVQQEDNEGYSALVDSWSVGVIVFSMLTAANAFLGEDAGVDIRHRIRTRVIDWQMLHGKGVSAEAEDFIRKLLEVRPEQRMSLTAARMHPWLAGQARARGLTAQAQAGVQPGPSNLLPEASMSSQHSESMILDASMEDAADPPVLGSQASNIGNMPGAYPSSQTGREGLRGAPLQRRSQVLAAEEDQQRVFVHSDGEEDNTPVRKRKAGSLDFNASLTPMREEEEEEEEEVPPPVTGRKKVRGTERGGPTVRPRRGKGAGGRVPATPSKRNGVRALDDEAPRRSTRLTATPQKGVRRG